MAKKDEIMAEHQLELALTHLQLAKEALNKASDIDDFPTARHEMSDLNTRCGKVLKDIEEIKSDLRVRKSK